MKNTYHSNIIIAYLLGSLPIEIERTIPSSTLYYWRKKGFAHFTGLDFVFDIDSDLSILKLIAQNKKLLQVSRALVHVFLMYRQIFNSLTNKKQVLLQNKSSILQCIEHIKPLVGMRRALQAFDLSYQLHAYWKRSLSCVHEPMFQCRKIFYNQLMPAEVFTIKEYLLKPEFLHWPVGSVYYQMIRDRAAFMAASTFYLYARLLNLTTLHRRRKPRNKKCGIRAEKSFQVLHVDITELRINDRQKLYISFIVDNFSRAILGWRASLRKTASLTLENLNGVIAKYKLFEFTLLADDGSENKGCVKDFIKTAELNINLQIAQCDISFSNSMVEAVFRILKLQGASKNYNSSGNKDSEQDTKGKYFLNS